MDTNEIILTAEGRAQMERDLAKLKQRREEIVAELQYARSQGDLSENNEYEVALDNQKRNDAAIMELEHTLNVAKVVDSVDTASVSIGSTVDIRDANGKTLTFTIVGSTQTNSLNHEISNESPAGRAMIGHVVGDQISFTTPRGKVSSYTITDIYVKASE
jgi:transcription elongation factor GreA